MEEYDDATNVLDQEARRRREEVNVKASQPLPDVIRSIESTTVIYTVDPDILPFSLIDPGVLVSKLGSRFSLKFRAPKFDPSAFGNLGLDMSKMTQEGIIRFLLQGKAPQIAFENGRYPTGPDSFVFISELAFTGENIAVKVKGITDVAQLVISEAFSVFWEAAGVSRRWDNPEVQKNVGLVSFQTVTNINLGTSAESLLEPGIRKFLDTEIPKPSGFGASMLPLNAFDKFQPNAAAISSWSFDQLVLAIHTFDPTCGRSGTARVDFDVTSRGDRGRGVVELSTELPFDRHVEFAGQIRQLLIQHKSGTKAHN